MNFNDIADIDSIRLDTPIASDSVPRWQRKAAAAAAQSENGAANVRATPQRTPGKALATATPAKTPSKTPKVIF